MFEKKFPKLNLDYQLKFANLQLNAILFTS
jgi:hypothetical protein